MSQPQQTPRETAIKEIRRLCDEALDHDIGWPSFRAMLAHRLKIEQAFIDMATTPNNQAEPPRSGQAPAIC